MPSGLPVVEHVLMHNRLSVCYRTSTPDPMSHRSQVSQVVSLRSFLKHGITNRGLILSQMSPCLMDEQRNQPTFPVRPTSTAWVTFTNQPALQSSRCIRIDRLLDRPLFQDAGNFEEELISRLCLGLQRAEP